MEITEMAAPEGTPDIARRVRRLATGATVLVAALGAAAAFWGTTAHAATSPTAVGVYTITNLSSGMVADITGGSTAWLTPIESWPANGGENQKWRFVQVGPTYTLVDETDHMDVLSHPYLIENEPNSDGSPECLEAEGNTPTAGDVVDLYGCNPNSVDQPNQLWYPVTTDGVTQLVNGISIADASPNGVFVVGGGDIINAGTDPANGGDNATNAALVLTGVGGQGSQLEVEPSQSITYGTTQFWNVQPTTYTVDAPQVTIHAADSSQNFLYGCVNGWNPQTYTENQLQQVNATLTWTNATMSGYVSTTSGSPSQYNLVDPLFGTNASSNGIDVLIQNPDLQAGSASVSYVCQSSSTALLDS